MFTGALVAGAEEEGFIRLEVPEDIDQRVKQVVAAMKEKASPVGGPAHLEAVKALRQLLSNCKNLLFSLLFIDMVVYIYIYIYVFVYLGLLFSLSSSSSWWLIYSIK